MAKKTARKFYRLPEFSEAVKAGILPAYVNTWGPAHRAVIEQMYNQACFADNVGKVVVQEAPCGSGKSTLADGITRLSGVEKLINMILMTDSNKRLSDDTRTTDNYYGKLREISTDIAFLSDGDEVNAEEWKSLVMAWLVTMSCQRYQMINDDARANACSCYRYDKAARDMLRKPRDLFAVDEKFDDVTIKDWYYSDLLRYAGIIRESIRPDSEWDENIGKTAEKAERYAMVLIEDLKQEICRINQIKLPELKNKKDGQMHIDVYLGCADRQEEALKKAQEYWDDLLPIIIDIRDGIKDIKKDMRNAAENRIFSDTAKIIKKMSGKMSEKKSETVINTFKDIVKVTDDMIHGRLRSEVRDMAVDAVAASERAFALEELEKILKNNRVNMYCNMGHVRKERVITAADFLNIFRPENKVFIRASTYGDDKYDQSGQIVIYCCKYNIDLLPYKTIKTVIYDGTASLDPVYDNKDIFDVVKYDKPKTHVKIVQMDERTNRSYVVNNMTTHSMIASNMRRYFTQKIDKREVTPEDIMISGYLDTRRNIAEAGLAWSTDYVSHGREPLRISTNLLATYGSAQVTGSNDYKDCSYLGKIGANILPNATIFMQLACRRSDVWEKLIEMEEGNRAKQLQLIFTNNGNWTDFKDVIDDCTLRTAMVSIVQEINRLRIRNWCERPEDAWKYDITVVWAWRGRQQGTYDPGTEEFTEKLIRNVMEYFGCDYRNPADYEYIPPVVCKRPVAVERKKTMIARLEEWYDSQKPNSKFTMADMAASIGVSRKALNSYLSRPEYEYFLLKIRGENDCYVSKAARRVGYVYTVPAKPDYEQGSFDMDIVNKAIDFYARMEEGKLFTLPDFAKMLNYSADDFLSEIKKPENKGFYNMLTEHVAKKREEADDGKVVDLPEDKIIYKKPRIAKPQVPKKTENIEKKSAQKNITTEKEKVQIETKKPKKAKYTDAELDSLGVSGIVDLLRKELTDNNSDNYGDCKDKELVGFSKACYFSLYLNGEVLNLTCPSPTNCKPVTLPIAGVAPSAIYHGMEKYCNYRYN